MNLKTIWKTRKIGPVDLRPLWVMADRLKSWRNRKRPGADLEIEGVQIKIRMETK